MYLCKILLIFFLLWIPYSGSVGIKSNPIRTEYIFKQSYPLEATQQRGYQISPNFYAAIQQSELAKQNMQELLQNFLENLQRNFTKSSPLLLSNAENMNKYQQLDKLHGLSEFFNLASISANDFSLKSKTFIELSKNESNELLLKLRRLPSTEKILPGHIKSSLTNYFTEMEFFHVMFSEIMDECLEYIIDTLRVTQLAFIEFANIQNELLRTWHLNPTEGCFLRYMDFLQEWSAEIFKCATQEHSTAYDIYALTIVTTKFILQQLEHRIQRLFNCFMFGHYKIRCRFLYFVEQDFKLLLLKLNELQIYYDFKIKTGHGTTFQNLKSETTGEIQTVQERLDCIPYGFPELQMQSDLKKCFSMLLTRNRS
ncbi:uncharacterized protein LOC119685387 [Teleopsis dalmanni]|uniref:uncharacterized protein LOC119685387 n=1 Tax=Teleopsis dalmanni TaxID=139649 RepID=UPI0018CE2D2E|nr:uncharacterized protein LOC119685387 [Teleopsis dalmanni]